MAKLAVIWTETAKLQRREILAYWFKRTKSAQYSEKLIQLIRERITIIERNSEVGKPADYPETREIAMGNFSIYYKTTKSNIYITSFWDNRQDPKKLLKALKNKT